MLVFCHGGVNWIGECNKGMVLGDDYPVSAGYIYTPYPTLQYKHHI